MAPSQVGGNECLSQSPQFFRVLFPNPFAYQRIPHNFHMYLPHELPKHATLSTPNGANWRVEIHKNGQDIYFQKGWSEFAKAHDIRTGYFLVFRYEGNMVFSVTVFDTTCCLKKYAQAPMQLTLHSVEIEDSSESSEETLGVETCDAETESSSDCLNKRKKLSNGEAQRIVEKKKNPTSQKMTRRRKTVRNSSEQTLGEKTEAENEVRLRATRNSRGIKWEANRKAKEEFRKKKKPALQKKERKKTAKIIHDSTNYRQFEKILTYSSSNYNELNLPKKFFVKNGLLEMRNIFVKTKISGKQWEMRIFFRESQARICKGWKEFAKENGLKAGDRVIFKLLSKDTFLVKLVVCKTSKSESKFKIKQERINYKKQVPFKKSTVETEFSTVIRHYNLRLNYLYLTKTFCAQSKLMSSRDVTLKDLEGNEWLVNFSYRREGRLNREGWRKFCTEKGLKEGHKCIFKLVGQDTILVQVIKSEQE